MSAGATSFLGMGAPTGGAPTEGYRASARAAASPAAKEARRFQVQKQKLRRNEIQKLWTTLDALVPGESEGPNLPLGSPKQAAVCGPAANRVPLCWRWLG